jgi:uncharacterized protein
VDWVHLTAGVLRGYRLHLSGLHGPAHGLRVRANALALAALTPGAEPRVVEAFALFHDGWRHDEQRDLGHGKRAAAAVRRWAEETAWPLGQAEACAWHEHGGTSTEPTIGCCWDADRPDLSRLGVRPRARLLSTRAAREPAVQAAAWERGARFHPDTEGATAWGVDARRL